MMPSRKIRPLPTMHEFSIMQSALEMAGKNARAAGATQIHRLRVRVGALSGVVPEALRFAFDGLKSGTVAEAAELEIEEVPAVCWCPACALEFEVPGPLYECPHCHQPGGQLRRGRELELASLEVS
jgi:hydrogenase nickel incorporation protein HypA/HybF